jgi:mRNA-degrading endonuclease RelE of RelBE toxin-antitoxin system
LSPKRKERVAPPAVAGEWDVRFGETAAAKGWDELCQRAAGNTRAAYEQMRFQPRPPEDSRHKRLRGSLGTRKLDSRELEQWQIEVMGGARIWYLVDDDKHTVWVVHAAAAREHGAVAWADVLRLAAVRGDGHPA